MNFSSRTCPGSVASTLEANKYKLLMRIPLDDLEIMKGMSEYIICWVCVEFFLFWMRVININRGKGKVVA